MKQLKRSSSGNPKNHFHGHYIPDEILNNILSRLPLKSLIRFQCVAKSWKTLINDPSFKLLNPDSYSIVRTYRRMADPPEIDQLIDRVCLQFQSIANPNSANPSCVCDEENIKKLHQFTGHHVFGFSNGLICFGDEENPFTYREEPFYLWNPGLNRVKKVPKLPLIPIDGCSSEIPSKYKGHIQNVLGLGFCGIKGFNDYKLVCVSFHHRPNLGFSPPHRSSYCRGHLNVYSLTSDSWKNIPSGNGNVNVNMNIPPCLWIHTAKFGRFAYVGGVHYWLINHLDRNSDNEHSDDEDYKIYPYSLVGFDLVNETFLDKEIKLPKVLRLSYVNDLYLLELNGSLALYEAFALFEKGCLWVLSTNTNGFGGNWSELFSFESNSFTDLLADQRLPYALQISLDHDREIDGWEQFYYGEITSYEGIYVKSLALLGVPAGFTGIPHYKYEDAIPLTDRLMKCV